MTKITYVNGDATKPVGEGIKVIPHICNDIGKWGRGFVVALSDRWKEPVINYKKWYKKKTDKEAGIFELGNTQFVPIPSTDIIIANMIGQHTIWNNAKGKPPIRYKALRNSLKKVALKCLELNASVHAPKFGAALAGGKWAIVENIIKEELCSKDIPVTIYLF